MVKMPRVEGAPKSEGRELGCPVVEAGVLGNSLAQASSSVCNPFWKKLCMTGGYMEGAGQH